MWLTEQEKALLVHTVPLDFFLQLLNNFLIPQHYLSGFSRSLNSSFYLEFKPSSLTLRNTFLCLLPSNQCLRSSKQSFFQWPATSSLIYWQNLCGNYTSTPNCPVSCDSYYFVSAAGLSHLNFVCFPESFPPCGFCSLEFHLYTEHCLYIFCHCRRNELKKKHVMRTACKCKWSERVLAFVTT